MTNLPATLVAAADRFNARHNRPTPEPHTYANWSDLLHDFVRAAQTPNGKDGRCWWEVTRMGGGTDGSPCDDVQFCVYVRPTENDPLDKCGTHLEWIHDLCRWAVDLACDAVDLNDPTQSVTVDRVVQWLQRARRDQEAGRMEYGFLHALYALTVLAALDCVWVDITTTTRFCQVVIKRPDCSRIHLRLPAHMKVQAMSRLRWAAWAVTPARGGE